MPLEDKDRTSHLDAELGFSLLRLTLGLNFTFHSYDRWRALRPFVESTVQAFAHTPLPSWSVRAFAYTIPFWEPAVGLLLVLGLWTRYALIGGGLLIAAFVFGTALRGDHTVLAEQLIYAGIFFVLLLFRPFAHDRRGTATLFHAFASFKGSWDCRVFAARWPFARKRQSLSMNWQRHYCMRRTRFRKAIAS